MEFEPDSPITDDQRKLAETRRVTVQPMNPFLKPEDNTVDVPSDKMIANVDRDTETTAELAKQASSATGAGAFRARAKHHAVAIVAISLSALLGVLSGVYFYLT